MKYADCIQHPGKYTRRGWVNQVITVYPDGSATMENPYGNDHIPARVNFADKIAEDWIKV